MKIADHDSDVLVSNLHRCGKDPLQWDQHSRETLDKISSGMSRALHDPKVFWFAEITAKLRVGFCQEIFPSQMFLNKSDGRSLPTKQLAKTIMSDGREAACFTSTKVGAAIQMVDDWWEEGAEKALRVSEYGADSDTLLARRGALSGRDFYSFLIKSDEFLKDVEKKGCISPDYHYLMAVLAKGGMFQKSKGK
ncbi:type I-F CRISPR-associated protein Cas7f/Csy3 [Halomonas sp. 1390]|uniref:type I-F CRISPR-associated protein Cas7f/Csy3 n=1 Tax=Halomonas sp. B23F22_3 TaxID=3459516 RepID=UPI00373FABA6